MDLCVKYEMVGYVAKINISFHNLGYFVVDFVQLALTNYEDAILVFLQSYSHKLDRYGRALLVNVLQIPFHDGGFVHLSFFCICINHTFPHQSEEFHIPRILLFIYLTTILLQAVA